MTTLSKLFFCLTILMMGCATTSQAAHFPKASDILKEASDLGCSQGFEASWALGALSEFGIQFEDSITGRALCDAALFGHDRAIALLFPFAAEADQRRAASIVHDRAAVNAAQEGQLDKVKELFPSASAAARLEALRRAAQNNRSVALAFMCSYVFDISNYAPGDFEVHRDAAQRVVNRELHEAVEHGRVESMQVLFPYSSTALAWSHAATSAPLAA